ncbi:MAG: methylated-DNA--[protein]-cysteine S-methyltransferase [Campylobacteraceae bacterium]|jgi:methylated-DNA-[protein]-cysteine S-methyltransferase|nr:methylated-DNA--[protein]-cysteine S-methyltransferase [Campylobacteraceae bacterium]
MSGIYTCLIDTPLGQMRASAKNEALTGLWFEGQKYYPNTKEWIEADEHKIFMVLKVWLEGYFAGKKRNHDFPLSPEGTPFQLKVWNTLGKIEYAKNTTYGKIAMSIAHDTMLRVSARAVGGAIRRNPISILIPCHRVIGVNQSLTGYAGGIDKKQFLLELESKYKN